MTTTTTPKQMTLEQVRDGLRAMKTFPDSLFSKWADAIDAELAKQRNTFTKSDMCAEYTRGREEGWDACMHRPSDAITLSEALRCLEDHALGGYTLQGDDVQRMQAVTDKLTGQQRNAEEVTAWINVDGYDVWTINPTFGDSFDVVRASISAVASRDMPKLDKPARVGAVSFGVGVPWSTVIGAAQRAYKAKPIPPEKADKMREMLDAARQENKP